MASIAAKEVAKEVLGDIGRGKKPNITKIAVKKGYTYKTANSGEVQKTKTFQKEVRPIVDRMIIARDKALALMDKTVSKAKYRDLSDGVSKLTTQIQLLSGEATERFDLKAVDEVRNQVNDLINMAKKK
jgi:ribosomal protein L17